MYFWYDGENYIKFTSDWTIQDKKGFLHVSSHKNCVSLTMFIESIKEAHLSNLNNFFDQFQLKSDEDVILLRPWITLMTVVEYYSFISIINSLIA